MKEITTYQAIIQQQLEKLDKEWADSSLYDPIRYILSLGGKRLRPALTLIGNDFFGGDPESIATSALGLEIFHNFTLMQDDIMDEAPLRRGKPAVHTKWGENATILSGDVMFSKAFSLVTSCEDKYLRKVLNLFNETAIEVCEGQHMDMEFEERNDVHIEEYIEMVRLKTAVIVGCALKLGAILADASEKEADLIYDFGINLGIAYQIQDDILDVFGNKTVFGKQVGGDIIANKKTYLLLKALEEANTKQEAALHYWLTEANFEASQKVQAITSIFSELQIKEQAENVMQFYYKNAIHALEKIDVSRKNKNYLLGFAGMLMQRSQ
ncbi:MAG: geranylgeranyl diphosphate synthase type II [Maribacter sp.]|jgi:geranylgeranyl diphosphate synthase type II